MNSILKKVLIAIAIIILIVALAFIIVKATKKNTEKKQEQKIEEKKKDEEQKDDDIKLPSSGIAKTIKCTYEGEEKNVIWENSYVTFNLDENNKVVLREDSRQYKFEQVDIDDYINNKTLDVISGVLNGINGISSSLVAEDESEHIYRFTTTFDFKELKLDDLYEFYYKRFYNNGSLTMTKEQFDARYKSLDYDDMAKAYIDSGYTCN